MPTPGFQPLLDALLEAACVIDGRSLQVLAANRSAAALWGCTVDDLVGRAVEDLATTPEDQLFWMQLASWPAGATLHSDSLVVRADGSSREVERRITALALGDGRTGWLLTLIDLSAQRRAEREVERLAGELGATLTSSRDAILVTDLEGRVRCWNPAFARLWALPAHLDIRREQGSIARLMRAAVDDGPGFSRLLAARMAELNRFHQANERSLLPTEPDAGPPLATDTVVLADGRTLERRLLPQYGRAQVVGWVQVWRDLSAQLADQARLQLAGQVFDSILDAVLVADADGHILSANPAAERLCDRSATALQGVRLADLLQGAQGAHGGRPAVDGETPRWHGELRLGTGQGALPVLATLVHIAGDGPHAGGCIAVLRDQRERQAVERQMAALAHTDALTGLANRLQLIERLDQEAAACAARTDLHPSGAAPTGNPPPPPADETGFALLLFGLDRFKHVNNSLGHPCGDEVLREAGRRLAEGLRLGDLVARLGGDTFAVLLPGADSATAEAVARRLLRTLQHDLVVDDLHLALSASVGVARFPRDGRSSSELLRNADSAMHRVKERHGGDVRFYQPQMHIDALDRIRLDHAMRRGLAQGDFRLLYQPQVDLASGGVVGAEALCRWTDTDLGEVSPGRFIPVAEETGFIAELGDWVLREAVAQSVRWLASGWRVPVSVNVSILQFQQPQFVARVAQVLVQAGLPPELLELELTESILVGDMDEILVQLHALAALGVRLAIDDFGTGYSSLGYLRRLPIHRLKIDRSFIQHLPDDASDSAITRTIVELAQALHLRVIAEGVENEAQRAHLASIGCDEFQGWLCAPALPALEFERLQPAPNCATLAA